ncbi:hypothetical protein [Sphingomonas montanisoli]|uniref:Uncharacterized protein n=1 Tax=Sphingomonas montanisoli TaxID=2606412 RepID=A0A5D9C851_9SPHN|nr:hypothetical protein [Sphingomonas montanisoli]TZG27889.1 hypothetical protein FYJ91_10100 [Sphingomonas montanisoli]
MSITLDDLFASPDHYLFIFDDDDAVFREMDREAYARSIFLDQRIEAASARGARVPIVPLLQHNQQRGGDAPEIGWIFHVAYCGSTLLARGIDRTDHSLVLREPAPLHQLAIEAAQTFAGEPANDGWIEGLRLQLAMLGRRYDADAPVVVKANVPVNFIIPELMALQPDAKGILLHFGLNDYLAAILRSDQHRDWIEMMAQELAPVIAIEAGPVDGLDTAQKAGALWLAQIRIYARALESWPQLRSLDAEALFTEPVEAIAAAAAYFGIAPASDNAITSLAAQYAKVPGAAFDNESRIARREENRVAVGPDIARARAWVDAAIRDRPLPERLANPLIGDGAPLL